MIDEREVVQGEAKPEEVPAGDVAAATEVVSEAAAPVASVPVANEAAASAEAAATPAPAPTQAPVAVPAPASAPAAPPTLTPSTKPSPHFGRYSVHEAQDMAKHAHADIFEHKVSRITSFIQKHGSITHHQAMDLLHVSRPMAYLYLWRLKRSGRLAVHKKGKEVHYTLPGATL
jgi:hypothetical protein